MDRQEALSSKQRMECLLRCRWQCHYFGVEEKKKRIIEIGGELFADGGVDALENFFFVLKNRITKEIGKDPSVFRSLWNGLTDEWKY